MLRAEPPADGDAVQQIARELLLCPDLAGETIGAVARGLTHRVHVVRRQAAGALLPILSLLPPRTCAVALRELAGLLGAAPDADKPPPSPSKGPSSFRLPGSRMHQRRGSLNVLSLKRPGLSLCSSTGRQRSTTATEQSTAIPENTQDRSFRRKLNPFGRETTMKRGVLRTVLEEKKHDSNHDRSHAIAAVCDAFTDAAAAPPALAAAQRELCLMWAIVARAGVERLARDQKDAQLRAPALKCLVNAGLWRVPARSRRRRSRSAWTDRREPSRRSRSIAAEEGGVGLSWRAPRRTSQGSVGGSVRRREMTERPAGHTCVHSLSFTPRSSSSSPRPPAAKMLCGEYSLRQAVTPIFPPIELRRCTATGARSLSMATPATEEQLRRGSTYRGDVELLRRVLRRASRGEPLTLWVFGGSISMGRDLPTRNTDQRRANVSNFFVEPQGMFADMLADWLQQELPPRDGARHRVFNFAQGARDSHGSIRAVEQALSAAGADEQAAALRAAATERRATRGPTSCSSSSRTTTPSERRVRRPSRRLPAASRACCGCCARHRGRARLRS